MNSKLIGRITGPIAFLLTLLFFHPEGLSQQANAVLAVTTWMAIWWITEAIPIEVTALLPTLFRAHETEGDLDSPLPLMPTYDSTPETEKNSRE